MARFSRKQMAVINATLEGLKAHGLDGSDLHAVEVLRTMRIIAEDNVTTVAALYEQLQEQDAGYPGQADFDEAVEQLVKEI